MKVSYNWLKWYIPDGPSAEELHDVLTYHLTEVEGMEKLPDGDTIFDVNILPNRAGDLLSHKGISQEIAGQLGISFTDPTETYKNILAKKERRGTYLEIELETENVRRYTARIIRNIKVGPSPDWVVKHLESIGQRSINNIVDATNLTMFNCGNPTHAFDLSKFQDQRIVLRNAKEGETLELVGREPITATLKSTDIVVANSKRETLALGGVKGSTNSGITDQTKDIVIEVANFDPTTVRKTARRIGVLSDAAKRFENNLSPELCSYAMLELSALICEMCPDAVFEDIIDVYPREKDLENFHTISFTEDYVNKKLGVLIEVEEIHKILKNYNFEYTFLEGVFRVTEPVDRQDLKNKVDMVEEIGRIYGYSKILPILPVAKFTSKENEIYTKVDNVRNDLISKGYKEVMTYSFTKKGDVQVARGLKGKDFLRTNLLDGLKESYELNKNNAPLLGLNEVKIFEIGTIFNNDNEEIHVAYIDKKEAKEFELHQYASPEASPLSNFSGPRVGSPDTEKLLNGFTIWSQYPFVTRDISVWVDAGTKENEITEKIKNSMGEMVVVGPTLFDTFTKDGRTSYAFRLVFQSFDKTLTGEEVENFVKQINNKLLEIKGLELR